MRYEVCDGLARKLVAQAVGQCQVGTNLPLVLPVEEEVVPVQVEHSRHARQVAVNLHVGRVVDEGGQVRVDEMAARRRLEELV
jgi:hypothetical protein